MVKHKQILGTAFLALALALSGCSILPKTPAMPDFIATSNMQAVISLGPDTYVAKGNTMYKVDGKESAQPVLSVNTGDIQDLQVFEDKLWFYAGNTIYSASSEGEIDKTYEASGPIKNFTLNSDFLVITTATNVETLSRKMDDAEFSPIFNLDSPNDATQLLVEDGFCIIGEAVNRDVIITRINLEDKTSKELCTLSDVSCVGLFPDGLIYKETNQDIDSLYTCNLDGSHTTQIVQGSTLDNVVCDTKSGKPSSLWFTCIDQTQPTLVEMDVKGTIAHKIPIDKPGKIGVDGTTIYLKTDTGLICIPDFDAAQSYRIELGSGEHKAATMSNTSGNYANQGWLTYNEDTVFYSRPPQSGSFLKCQLVSQPLDGSGDIEVINSQEGRYDSLGAQGHDLSYLLYTKLNEVVSLKSSPTQVYTSWTSRVDDTYTHYLRIEDGYAYYTKRQAEYKFSKPRPGNTYRCAVDGSDEVLLATGEYVLIPGSGGLFFKIDQPGQNGDITTSIGKLTDSYTALYQTEDRALSFIQTSSDKLYFAEGGTDVKCCNFDGSDLKTLFTTSSTLSGMNIYANKILYSTDAGGLFAFDLNSSEIVQLIKSQVKAYNICTTPSEVWYLRHEAQGVTIQKIDRSTLLK